MNKKTKQAKKNRVAVALSGGIDSAFPAYILKARGFEIFGIAFKTYRDDSLAHQVDSVKEIAERLSIEYYILDLEDVFEKIVVEPFCKSYLQGMTPNPCVECNMMIKFGILWEKSRELGADYIATGHYVRSVRQEKNNNFLLKKGLDKKKDQSYFLWKLTQQQLKRIKFPLGEYTKNKVRDEVNSVFPHLKSRAESQEICFMGGKSIREFLQDHCMGRDITGQGTVLDTDGKIIGRHDGFIYYTIGQRKGLGISHSRPLYVKEIIPGTNTIILGEKEEIYRSSFYIRGINLISGETAGQTFKASTKIRYNSPEFSSKIQLLKEKRALVEADIPQEAVTPGQSAVFYNGNIMIGGGIIE